MREEDVTKAILKWLLKNKWEIVCFDFPQSGTGRFLHPNKSVAEKNKGAINPDIVAFRNNVCLFFENKDHYYLPDFEKLYSLKTENDYSDDIDKLLAAYSVERTYYGIGLPVSKYRHQAEENAHLVDFVLGVDDDLSVVFLYYSGDYLEEEKNE